MHPKNEFLAQLFNKKSQETQILLCKYEQFREASDLGARPKRRQKFNLS